MFQTINLQQFHQHFSRFKPDLSGFTIDGFDADNLKQIVSKNLSELAKTPHRYRLSYQGFTWLHFMVLNLIQEPEKFVYLIQDAQVDINSIATNFYFVDLRKDEMTRTSSGNFFHMLLAYESVDLAQSLIPLLAEKKFAINCIDGENKTVLITAAKIRATDIVCQLLESFKDSIDVNAQDSHGRTALHYAAAYGDITMATALLNAGANWKCKDKLSHIPMMYVDEQQKDWIHAMFLSIEIWSDRDFARKSNILQLPISQEHQRLLNSVVDGMLIENQHNLQQLFDYGKIHQWPKKLMQVIGSALQDSGKTLLQVCLDGHPAVREALLSHEKQYAIESSKKEITMQSSPTHADSPHSRFFSTSDLLPLVSKYKLKGTTQEELEKCLRRAAAMGNLEDVSLLIHHGVNVNASDKTPGSGKTALDWAKEKHQSEYEALLLKSGATSKQDVPPTFS